MQRVVAILESVAGAANPTTPARVGEQTSLSLSTVSRIMRELAVEGMLDRAADGTYVLGARVFQLTSDAASRGDRTIAVSRVLQELRDLTEETASLHVRRADQRVCIASAMSRHQLRRVLLVGDSVNLVGTVPGDVLMTDVSDEERDALVTATMDGTARVGQLEKMRGAAEHGFSVSVVESIGLTGISVPVRLGGLVVAALTLSGPTTRLTVDAAMSWLPDLKIAAKRLEPWLEVD